MNPTTHKKVAVRHQQFGLLAGFVDPTQLGHRGSPNLIDLLTQEGQVTAVELNQVLAIYFIADFGQTEALRGLPVSARGAVRLPGLWVRVRCKDRYSVEGILVSELLELEMGIWLLPLAPDSPWQRVFLPRTAVEQISPIELVRSPRRRRSPALSPRQFGLFGEGSGTETASGAEKEHP